MSQTLAKKMNLKPVKTIFLASHGRCSSPKASMRPAVITGAFTMYISDDYHIKYDGCYDVKHMPDLRTNMHNNLYENVRNYINHPP